jgi:hypothetical protein
MDSKDRDEVRDGGVLRRAKPDNHGNETEQGRYGQGESFNRHRYKVMMRQINRVKEMLETFPDCKERQAAVVGLNMAIIALKGSK